LLALLGIASAAAAQTYDARTDFSFSHNPNGVWTYGWSTDLAGQLNLYGDPFTVNGGLEFWGDDSIEELNDPHVGYSALDALNSHIPAHALVIHPGPGNQFSHCVWTAPAAGAYNIQASFTSLWTGGPHAYLLKNGAILADSLLTMDIPWPATFNTVTLAAGDTIEAVIGVGLSGVFFNDETEFSLTITAAGTPAGVLMPGEFRGLVTSSSGSGLVEGEVTARVEKTGAFRAQLNLGGVRTALKGMFSTEGVYSSSVKLKDGTEWTLSLSFDGGGNLVGTLSNGSGVYSFSAGAASGAGSAQGEYTFTVEPGQAFGVGTAPGGVGYGYLNVHSNGEVTIVGHMADGSSFSTSSWVTAGSSVPVYVNPVKHPGSEIGGTLVFSDVSQTNEWTGTLFWARPPSPGLYPAGFELDAGFDAVPFDPRIVGLNHDQVDFSARGGGLRAEVLTRVTLNANVPFASLYGGSTAAVRLALYPRSDLFFGSFEDRRAHVRRSFVGVISPGSRTGAGFFLSGGLSGTVQIAY